MKNSLEIALAEVGIQEVKGKKANPRIMRYAEESGVGDKNYSDERAWCSVFVNWVAYKAGLERTGSPAARSWLNVGIPIENPEPGDVVIFWRKDINSVFGHVGFFNGYASNGDRIYCLGGNQDDSVSVSARKTTRLLGFRRLRPIEKVIFSKKELKKGSAGKDVMELQDGLKILGYDCGTSDGVFGEKTESALKLFQTTFFWVPNISVTGIFDKETQEFMAKTLNKFKEEV